MNGVRILHTISNPIYGFGLNWKFVVALIITAFVIVCMVFVLKYNKEYLNQYLDNDSFALIIIFIFSITITILALFNGKVVDTYSTYEVCIDNSTNMMEFLKQYEILEQREEILIIKEREN